MERIRRTAGWFLVFIFPFGMVAACGGGGGQCRLLPESIDVDTTLTEGCYLAEQDVFVTGSVTLKIEPGVEIVFSQGKVLHVTDPAGLSAVGTADKPIVFTGAEKSRGFWGGIVLTNANSTDNRFEYVTVEYGGSYEIGSGLHANLALDSSGLPVRLAMSHSTLRESSGYGLFLDDTAVLPGFAHNTLSANTLGAAFVFAEVAGQLDDTSIYSGNDQDLVFVECAYGLVADQIWPAIDVEYRMHESLIVAGHLTLAPGARLVFAEDAGLEIVDPGTLSAAGTASEPILFTGAEQLRGYWRGVIFTNSDHVENRLDYLTIEYGGGWEFEAGLKANLALDSSGFPVSVQITNTTIRQSEGYGLFLDQTAELPGFMNNTISANADGAALVLAEAAGQLDDSSTYTGNDQDVVFVECAYGLSISQTWPAIDADYRIHESLLVSSHLTIAPGARLVFMQDAGLEVYNTGALTAAGTSSAPIVFTGEQATAGYWRGVIFTNSNHTENRFDYLTVEHGGGWDFGEGHQANIALDSSGFAVSLEMTNSVVRHSGGFGLWLAQEAVVNAAIDSANTFSDNTDGDIFRE